MQVPPYKTRSFVCLDKALRKMLNTLCLRDWQVTLTVGSAAPEGFASNDAEGGGCCLYNIDYLTADIWIDPFACKRVDSDPLWILGHEVGHIWINVIMNEEIKCSLIGTLLHGRLSNG